MRCHYYDHGRCRSCTWLPTPYPQQVTDKERAVRRLLDPWPEIRWLPTVTSAEAAFRTKAKMVVGGSVSAPTLGLATADLRECPLYSASMHGVLDALARFLARAEVEPYDLVRRAGEAKHVLVTESPDGEYLVRLVLRSQESVSRIRKHLPWLLAEAPGVRVVTVNLQPEHKAVLEGAVELVLTEQSTLPMRLDGVVLHLGPRSFFQTNTDVAAALYRQARAWADDVAPRSVLDLYCGVGGFALHLAAPGRAVHGVEVSEAAVESARLSASEQGLAATFAAGDATAAPIAADLVVVNPPRRGLGLELCAALEASSARSVVYSSCNADTLARDLAELPSFAPVEARLLDMFPHSPHYETIVLLQAR